MLQKTLKYAVFGKFFCGLEHASENGIAIINGLVLAQQKNEFAIHKKFCVDAITKLKDHIDTTQHLFVTINTDKVLFKSLEGCYDPQTSLSMTFPNLKIEEFFYQVYSAKDSTHVAICRKDTVNDILKQYQSEQLNVIGFSLGNLGITQLEAFINESSIQTSNSNISFIEKKVARISTKQTTSKELYTINGLEVSSNDILSLAGVISYYTKQKYTISNFDDVADELNGHFKQKRLFDIGLKTSLATIFLLLLGSFLFLSSYNTKINTLNAEIELNKTYKKSLLKLNDEVIRKESLVTDFSSVSSKASWYADQIGSSIPASILLSEMQFHPLKNAIKEEEEIIIESFQILVKGKVRNNADFSEWTSQLERMSWVDNISIQEFGTGKKSTTEFELLLKYKD